MTNKEAIKRLEEIDIRDALQEDYDALDMAIQALSQEPCDNAISREWLKTAIHNFYYGLKHTPTEEDIQAYIDAAPPVTQKSETVTEFADRCRECGKMRKGHWIYDETIENWRCSKCNETPKTMGYVGTADFMAEHFKFCNHCGAKMVEPQERESDA